MRIKRSYCSSKSVVIFAKGEPVNSIAPDPRLILRLLIAPYGSFLVPNFASLFSAYPLSLPIFIHSSLLQSATFGYTSPPNSSYYFPKQSFATGLPNGPLVIPPSIVQCRPPLCVTTWFGEPQTNPLDWQGPMHWLAWCPFWQSIPQSDPPKVLSPITTLEYPTQLFHLLASFH